MQEVLDFFNNPLPLKDLQVKIGRPLTDGISLTKDDPTEQLDKPMQHRRSVIPSGTDYAREVRKQELEMYKKHEADRHKWESQSAGLDSMEKLSSWGTSTLNIGQLTEEAMTSVYNKYTFKKQEDTNKLAIDEFKQEILDGIGGFSVTIIEGPTGCGKTTQVPQWILDDCYQKRKPCKIVVTQPRKIAAISIARRVAQERGWDVKGVVGYQVALENFTSADTRISYVTTGVLLQKLVAAKSMGEYTHIILDEIHERGQEMDFLLLVVKRLLYTVSPNVKVILMSATFNQKSFADYFMVPTPEGQMASCIKIVKKEPMFIVKTFYLNHLTKFGGVLNKLTYRDEPNITPEMHHLVIKLLNAFEQIDKQEDRFEDRSEADLPSVLIFLPGINEIDDLFQCLHDLKLRREVADAECATYDWWVLPLHSTITADEQARVFQRAAPGKRKIILATNIAESSITVPDIKYVIDYCLSKVLVADEHTNFTSLQLQWATKTNCEQRSGRAGRVRDGRVYRLVTDKFYESLKQECTPEILRCPLERLVLLAKTLEMGPPSDVLALAMDPPDLSNVYRTILVLKEMGALKKTLNDEWHPSDGDMTYLGRIMAKLPLDVRASKLIVLGYIFGVLEEAVVMAAAMSVKNLFSIPFRERLNAYNSKLTWADGSMSDCIAFLNVYKVWSVLTRTTNEQQRRNQAHWARRFFVQIRSMRELGELVKELKMRLSREGIESCKEDSPWDSRELPLVYKLILAGAVYPQYFVQSASNEDRERDAVRVLGGNNPRNTVYLKNFPDNQPREIYAGSIRKIVKDLIGDEPRVTFDKATKKVYLTFGDGYQSQDSSSKKDSSSPTIPGQVVLPVYKAVKACQLNMDIRLKLLAPDQAMEMEKALELQMQANASSKMVPRLPEVDDSHFPLVITEKISMSKFWVQYDDKSTADELQQIQRALNSHAHLLVHTGPVAVGDLFAGPFVDSEGTTIHRVRVLRQLQRDTYEVRFIDYGTPAHLNASNLYTLPAGVCTEIPPLAMMCVLAEIAPNPLLDSHGHWSQKATSLFTSLVSKGQLIGKVYSVTHGVVSIELMANMGRISINKELLKQQLAVPCEESYESKINHDLRQTATELNLAQKRAFNREQRELAAQSSADVAPPDARLCKQDVSLKGPYSPLETVVHNLMYSSREKQVQIEWNSVNSVLLDTEPQQLYERLLVAAEVGQNERSSKLTLRHTTLLPNIPGLPAIIALLFCPVAELRRDAIGTRYVSVLCGLGSDEDGNPYFPEHDLLINIDADLDVKDIGTINHIRYLMDYMMFCEEGQDVPGETARNARVPSAIRKDILELLRKRRKTRTTESVINAWEWKSVPEHELLEITVPEMVERSIVYPLHTPLELKPVSREVLEKLKEENEQLKLRVNRTHVTTDAELICKLCNAGPMNVHAMRIHLYSSSHQEKEDDFRGLQA